MGKAHQMSLSVSVAEAEGFVPAVRPPCGSAFGVASVMSATQTTQRLGTCVRGIGGRGLLGHGGWGIVTRKRSSRDRRVMVTRETDDISY